MGLDGNVASILDAWEVMWHVSIVIIIIIIITDIFKTMPNASQVVLLLLVLVKCVYCTYDQRLFMNVDIVPSYK